MPKKSPTRELLAIAVLATMLALVYNFFSPKGIPLIKTQPLKEAVSDSALFAPPPQSSDPHAAAIEQSVRDSAMHAQGKSMTTPQHEKAMHNPDSVSKAVDKERDEKEKALKIVSLEQVKRLLEQKRGVFIDARSEEDYRKAHIYGARNMFGDTPERYFEEIMQIPRDTLIVIYCNNPQCHLGRVLAEFMMEFDYKNMYLYDDGWDGWTAAGMPVDSSSNVQ